VNCSSIYRVRQCQLAGSSTYLVDDLPHDGAGGFRIDQRHLQSPIVYIGQGQLSQRGR
jgi:hypothetical protein